MPPKLVATGVAAQAIGVDRGTLVRWWQQKKVTPAVVTPGGHARWDLEDLRRQLDALRDRD
ncbi:MerR family transcriptional regulator [Amycolatopsis thailandensis]|uniref:MerR family transcriptional regulator n=1 Tax=Amycolatopsis thailandensis TaxID=589330 RepID=UPI00379C2053